MLSKQKEQFVKAEIQTSKTFFFIQETKLRNSRRSLQSPEESSSTPPSVSQHARE